MSTSWGSLAQSIAGPQIKTESGKIITIKTLDEAKPIVYTNLGLQTSDTIDVDTISTATVDCNTINVTTVNSIDLYGENIVVEDVKADTGEIQALLSDSISTANFTKNSLVVQDSALITTQFPYLYTPPQFTILDPNTLRITEINGVIWDEDLKEYTPVEIAQVDIALTFTQQINYIYLYMNGTVVKEITLQGTKGILLCIVSSENVSTITNVFPDYQNLETEANKTGSLQGLIRFIYGNGVFKGMTFSHSTVRKMQFNGGEIFNPGYYYFADKYKPDVIPFTAIVNPVFRSIYRSSPAGYTIGSLNMSTQEFPLLWNNLGGNVLEAMSPPFFYTWIIFMNNTGLMFVVYPQKQYNSLDNAKDDVNLYLSGISLPPESKTIFKARTYICTKYNATSFAESADTAVGSFTDLPLSTTSSQAVISNHSLLSDLDYFASGHTGFQKQVQSLPSIPTFSTPGNVGDIVLYSSIPYVCTNAIPEFGNYDWKRLIESEANSFYTTNLEVIKGIRSFTDSTISESVWIELCTMPVDGTTYVMAHSVAGGNLLNSNDIIAEISVAQTDTASLKFKCSGGAPTPVNYAGYCHFRLYRFTTPNYRLFVRGSTLAATNRSVRLDKTQGPVTLSFAIRGSGADPNNVAGMTLVAQTDGTYTPPNDHIHIGQQTVYDATDDDYYHKLVDEGGLTLYEYVQEKKEMPKFLGGSITNLIDPGVFTFNVPNCGRLLCSSTFVIGANTAAFYAASLPFSYNSPPRVHLQAFQSTTSADAAVQLAINVRVITSGFVNQVKFLISNDNATTQEVRVHYEVFDVLP